MRLINVTTMRLEEYFGFQIPPYAILSHCVRCYHSIVHHALASYRSLLTATQSSGAQMRLPFRISPVQIGAGCVEPRRSNAVPLFVANMAGTISGSIPAASTRAVAPSSPRLSIPCISGTPNQKYALRILTTSTVLKEWKQFEKADGSREAGPYKS